MSSNLKVNTILPSTGTTVAVSGIVSATGVIETTGSELKITGAEPRLTFTDTDNNPDFQIWANAERFSIYDNTNNATRLRIAADGKVGIATDNPARELHIHSPDSGSTYIALTNSTTGITNGDGFAIGLGGDEVGRIWNLSLIHI